MRYANNLTLVRLILALIVVLVHFCHLLNLNTWLTESSFISSKFAVEAFFVISGYLIFMSYDNSTNFRQYLGKRLYRIYPAYFIVVLSCSLLLFFLSTQSFNEYFSIDFIKYLVSNLLMLNFLAPTLPGVFVDNAFFTVNGALWTLKIELIFYLFVPIIAHLIRRYGFLKIFCISYLVSESYVFLIGILLEQNGGLSSLSHQFPAQLRFFMFGSLFYYYGKELINRRYELLILGIFFALANVFLDFDVLRPLSSGLLLMVFSLYFPVYSIDKFGDYSYGVYIFHFPLIQTLIALGLFDRLDLFYFSMLFLSVLSALSFFSWHLVEKKFKFKRHKLNE